ILHPTNMISTPTKIVELKRGPHRGQSESGRAHSQRAAQPGAGHRPGGDRGMAASLDGLIDESGRSRARYVMLRMLERSRQKQIGVPSLTATDYVNTIGPENEPWFPG